MKGKILSVIAGVYTVYLEDRTYINISPKGKFRHLKIKPLVGDFVNVENGVINEIFPRNNQLIRPAISNIDLGIIVVSLVEPIFSSYLLDKFLTLLKMNHIDAMVILTKEDLYENKYKIEEIVLDYAKINVQVIPFSKKTNLGIEKIRKMINGKTIAFMGQTGVGKSSLINALSNDFSRKIGEYSKSLNRGKHQTKEVIIMPFENSFIADTPGFSSLELNCFKEELKDFFPFFVLKEKDCFFLDCTHINEPKCEIRRLVDEKIILEEHYNNYKQIYNELIFRKDRFK